MVSEDFPIMRFFLVFAKVKPMFFGSINNG